MYHEKKKKGNNLSNAADKCIEVERLHLRESHPCGTDLILIKSAVMILSSTLCKKGKKMKF